MTKNTQSLLLNYLFYNLMWLGCILFQERFLLIVTIWAVWHIVKLASPAERSLSLLIFLFGVMLDSALMQLGVFQFEPDQSALFVPVWLWAIWLSFSLTIYHSMSPLSHSFFVQILVGALVVPIAYFIGRKFGAVEFGYSDAATFITLGVVWGILLPSIFWLKNIIDTIGVTNENANFLASDD